MIKLNKKQQRAYDLYTQGSNLFITGSGGKGKSVIIKHILEYHKDSCVCIAPTAVSSVDIGAATIHSQFKFPLGYMYPSRRENVSDNIMDLFGKNSSVRTLIIDEISMVRSDTLEAINKALQKARRSKAPFGGVQIIAVGDFFQLPPVVNKNSSEGQMFFKEFKNEFCFSTEAWKSAGLVMIDLETVMRQTDKTHIFFLEQIRTKGSHYKEAIKYFNHIGADTSQITNPVILCTTNAYAHAFNIEFYDAIDEPEHTFYATNKNYSDAEPVPSVLKLKVGVKVMCRINTPTMINGDTGIVEKITDDRIYIKKENGVVVSVEKATWQQIEYTLLDGKPEQSVVGTFAQFPLIYGYAVTIHKSQGLSLDEVALELGKGCFCAGQLYVALSRCRTTKGFGILSKTIDMKDVIVDERVIQFYKNEKDRVLDLT